MSARLSIRAKSVCRNKSIMVVLAATIAVAEKDTPIMDAQTFRTFIILALRSVLSFAVIRAKNKSKRVVARNRILVRNHNTIVQDLISRLLDARRTARDHAASRNIPARLTVAARVVSLSVHLIAASRAASRNALPTAVNRAAKRTLISSSTN